MACGPPPVSLGPLGGRDTLHAGLGTMAHTDFSSFTPAGWHVITPRIVVHGAQQLVAFVNHVFGATGDYRTDRPTVLNIGGSLVMVSESGIRPPMPAFLYVYVADTDSTYRRAVEAGP